VGEETPDLKAALLGGCWEAHEGIATEVAESMDVDTAVLGRASRKLPDEGKIRKEDKACFPVISK
jgi:hypothetical protein